MLLPYGKTQGKLTHISEVSSGRTVLRCPYCEAALLAKKGRQIAHHFAHLGKSCLSTGSASLLDLGKKLPTQLSLSEYAQRKQGSIQQALVKCTKQVDFLQKKDLQNKRHLRTLVEYLKAQQQQLIARSVVAYVRDEFAPFPKIQHLSNSFAPHVSALKNYHKDKYQLAEVETKLCLYQKELKWFHSFQLYFLEIQTGEYHVFYKIGLTARDISERVQEIRQDLKQFEYCTIRVLFLLQGVAFLETFFKQKYRPNRYELGQHTEYFTFDYYELEAIKRELEKLYQPI